MRKHTMRILVVLALLAACRTAPVPVPVTSGIAAVNGTTLWWEMAGRGPTVVLLHGGNLDHRMWDGEFATLARDHRVLRYDARGFGRSGPQDTTFAAHEDLLALLRHLKVGHATLVGLSLGGRIATDFALAHPEMVERLVLAGPGMSGWQWTPESNDDPWRVEARAALARGDTVGVALAWLGSDYMKPAMEQPAVAARLRQLSADSVGYWKVGLRVGDVERDAVPPAAGRFAELRMPLLAIVGDRDTPDIRRIVDSLAVAAPRARKVVIAGAGHMVNMERPAEFDAALLRWLRETR